MVPIPEEYTYKYWLNGPSTDFIELTCLMPNGIVILLSVPYNASFGEVKIDLWDEASKYPLHGKLDDVSQYVFMCVNSEAELETLNDESRRICDIRPTAGVLRITKCIGEKADGTLNVQIKHIIGKRLQDFDQLNSAEVNDFRFRMKKLGDEISQDRQAMTWQERLFYQFPPRIMPISKALRDTISQSFQNGNIVISSKFEDNDNAFKFNVPFKIKPDKLLETILTKKSTLFNIKGEKASNYILKVCGQDEYLVGNYEIIEFQYIQECIAREAMPTVVTVSRNKVPVFPENNYECLEPLDSRKNKPAYNTLTLRKKGKQTSAWAITDKFEVTLCSVTCINCDMKRVVEYGIQAGLFHGGKSLCQPLKTSERQISEACECIFDETLAFDIQVCNIPRNAKLCFVIYEVSKNSKGSKTRKIKELANKDMFYNPIAWANTAVFDFKNQLKNGAMTLYMWTYAEDMMSDDVLHPLGTVVSNPNKKLAPALTLTFNSCSTDQIVYYPSVEQMLNYADEKPNYEDLSELKIEKDIDVPYCRKLIFETDSLYEVHDQDRKNIWSLRRFWMQNEPDFLPKLLYCMDWDNKEHVCEVALLLRDWPRLSLEKALELLDYAYADQEVRNFAVKCLTNVSDEDLLLYLLQLVQAIKHELYLSCDLVKFLLERALKNQKIGHYLFWHLRAEMQVPSVSVRFGLILEAYCRGSQEHMDILLEQIECLEKLKKCSEQVRSKRDKDKAKAEFQRQLDVEKIRNIRSPLDPSYRCNGIRIDKCRVMDSKMRPLWIVFQNTDSYGEDVHIIFKNGDDLRQDMLTLQMLRIMDKLWKGEGLDLRMNPYNCISTEYRVGLIEVVLNAETIANIQKEKVMFSATSAFRKDSILSWLKENNPTETALKKAINEFTLSCAGYCVATYVLGIADRHSDNIMVKKTGQLFHIDFGHILGHFKEKFGFKRERVPFVLTHDFVHVINKGQKSALEFKIFQEYCEKAFMILRRHGNLILSLCAMMISTGLPELSSEKDLNYLRDTLVLSKSEDEALSHFRSKFDEALSNSWKTSINWATHNLAKNNKA